MSSADGRLFAWAASRGGHDHFATDYEVFVAESDPDSLDLVELIMSMEEEFDVDISDEDAEKLVTVKDAFDYIKEH